MTLYKEINGKAVRLSPQEEQEVLAEWETWKTEVKPKERQQGLQEEKIQRKMRELAIRELIYEGELPPDFKDEI